MLFILAPELARMAVCFWTLVLYEKVVKSDKFLDLISAEQKHCKNTYFLNNNIHTIYKLSKCVYRKCSFWEPKKH